MVTPAASRWEAEPWARIDVMLNKKGRGQMGRFAFHTEHKGIEDSIALLAGTAKSDGDWLAALKSRHPDATKGELVRAAFRLALYEAETEPELARRVHQFGLYQRSL